MNSTGETPVTAAARHWRPVTLVLMAAVLAAMAVLAYEAPPFGWDGSLASSGWDRELATGILPISSLTYYDFMKAVSFPGNREGVIVTMLAGAALAAWRLGWRAGLLVIAALALMGLDEVFKDVVGRPRPRDPGPWACECDSFPSGHTLHAVLTSGLLWLLVMPRLTQAHASAHDARAVLLVWPVLVGISRVHLERHWPSDVLGAYVFGAALLIAMAWVWPRVAAVRPRIEYGAGSGPVDTVRPGPVDTVRSGPVDTVHPEPSQPVRPEPVEGLSSQQGDAK